MGIVSGTTGMNLSVKGEREMTGLAFILTANNVHWSCLADKSKRWVSFIGS